MREMRPEQDGREDLTRERSSVENLESEMQALGDGKTGLWGEPVSGEETPVQNEREQAYYETRRQERHARVLQRRKRQKRNRRIAAGLLFAVLLAAGGFWLGTDAGNRLKETGLVQTLASLGKTQADAEEAAATTEETTAAPEETAAATEETTAAPEETAATTEETTAAPEETEATTEETTAVTEEAAATPEETTAAAEETTATAEEAAAAAEETAAVSVESETASMTEAAEETAVTETAAAETGETAAAAEETASETESVPESETVSDEFAQAKAQALAAAESYAVQYDYDSAIQTLKSVDGYKDDTELTAAIKKYKKQKKACVEYPLDQITHVFFHTLINDTSRAFDGDYKEGGYNQVMTTVSEFNKIIQILYDKGYVLVSPHDMATVNEDGTMSEGTILLPEGKTPFVLSQDDVSYYHYMDGDGFASKLVLDENGEVKAEYVQTDGTTVVGDYDLVPLLDTFIKEHPDFSYHGRKGILAMTGYDGVFGYRTDIAYKTGENLQDDQKEFLENHPDFDYDQEVADATAIADAMKATGWEFASHTWGHRNATTCTAEELKTDNEKWEAYVKPILGDTDMIIFAFGGDIGDWQEYTLDNEKYAYYKSCGYNYYCNVDSNQYWVQITDTYFRQGRRNLDGYRMYYNPEMLSDLFEVADVWDSARPTPVPSILDTEGENG